MWFDNAESFTASVAKPHLSFLPPQGLTEGEL
jgi:hypothetical protein